MENIPLTAWEQGFIVVLFAVFVLAFLGGVWLFIKWMLKWLDNITEKNRVAQNEFFDEQRQAQQSFQMSENEKYRKWQADIECASRKQMGQISETLEALCDGVRGVAEQSRALALQLTQHNDRVDEKFNHAVQVVKETYTGTNGKSHKERRGTEQV